jgi:hypothetical protein
MEIRKAFALSEELGVLKYFPSNSAAVTKIAQLIAELCADEGEANTLIEAMCDRFDEWPGPVTLRQVYAEVLGPPQTPSWKPNYCAPPPPAFQACEDKGFHRTEPSNFYRRCDCDAGLQVSDELIEGFNRWQQKQQGAFEISKKSRVH